MKLKSFLLMALAASTTLAACDKSESSGPGPDNTPKSVTVTLPNIDQTPRAMGEALGANQAALKNFKIFFVDAAGNVQTVPAYPGETAQQVYFEGANIPQTKTYHFIPAAATKVVVVGNLGDITDANYTTEVANKTLPVLNDGDTNIDMTDDGKHPLYPLYGAADLTPKDGNDGTHDNLYAAAVILTPQVARFEINSFTYALKDGATTYSYDKLRLDKIALSNYYTSYKLATGDAVTGEGVPVVCPDEPTGIWDWINNAANAANVAKTPWANKFSSFEVGQGAMVNVKKNAEGMAVPSNTENAVDGIITYGLTKVAASTDTSTPGANNPELMLAFYGVKDGQQDMPLYLRGKFTSNDPFQPGKIYQVNFKITDGSWTQPERCVELTVSVKNWEIVTVTPEF